MNDAGVQFHEGIPETDRLRSWFPKGGLLVLVLDDLMAEGGEDLKSCWIYSPNIVIIKISPCCTFVPRYVSTREIS